MQLQSFSLSFNHVTDKVHYSQQVTGEVGALSLSTLTEQSEAQHGLVSPPHSQIELNLIRDDW